MTLPPVPFPAPLSGCCWVFVARATRHEPAPFGESDFFALQRPCSSAVSDFDDFGFSLRTFLENPP